MEAVLLTAGRWAPSTPRRRHVDALQPARPLASATALGRRARTAAFRTRAASDVVSAPSLGKAGLWEITDEVVRGLLTGYKSQRNEYDYWVPESLIDGEIPKELEGTLFKNGPGLVDVAGTRLDQPFDGDGMISQFAFRDGRLHYRNRFVRTEGFVQEQQAGRMLFKGAFSTGNPTGGWFYNPFNFSVKNVANTGVLYWAGILWALHESGLPYKMDARSLATEGESTMEGSIDGKGPLAAHYRVFTEADGSKRFCAFGSAVSGTDANLAFYEFGEDGRLLHKKELTLKEAGFAFFHDQAITEHYYVLLQNPTKLDVKKLLLEYMLGKCSIAECIAYDASLPTKVHLIPRPGRGSATREQRVYETAPFFSFHHANAFETGNALVVDTVAWDSLSFSGFNLDSLSAAYYAGGQRSELQRLVMHLGDDSGRATRQSLSHRCCEFPAINPALCGKPHRYMYAPAAAIDDPFWWGPNQVLMKMTLPSPELKPPFDAAAIETELWAPGQHSFLLEPLFVARPGGASEDDGWLILLVHNADTQHTELCVLDAQRIAAGPVCTIKLPHLIPIGLHGSWTGEYLGPALPEPFPTDWQPTINTIK